MSRNLGERYHLQFSTECLGSGPILLHAKPGPAWTALAFFALELELSMELTANWHCQSMQEGSLSLVACTTWAWYWTASSPAHVCKISKRCTLPGTTVQIITARTGDWKPLGFCSLGKALSCIGMPWHIAPPHLEGKKNAKNPQKKRKKSAKKTQTDAFSKSVWEWKKNAGNSEMYNQFKHFFKLRPFAVFCVRFAFFLRPFAVLNFPHNLRSGHCSSKFLAAVHIGKPTWHCYGLECDLLLQIHLRPLQ